MPDTTTLLTFVAAALALLLIPGPSVLYIVARSLEQGRRAGLIATLGVQTGALVHVLIAMVSLSSVNMASAGALSVMKAAGAAFLIVLGVVTLWPRRAAPASGQATAAARSGRSPAQLYWQGALVNALNPKRALFYVVFLPRFVEPERGPVWTQTLTLGLLFVALALISDSAYAVLAGGIGQKWQTSQASSLRWQTFVTGGIYIALGVGTAAVGHR